MLCVNKTLVVNVSLLSDGAYRLTNIGDEFDLIFQENTGSFLYCVLVEVPNNAVSLNSEPVELSSEFSSECSAVHLFNVVF